MPDKHVVLVAGEASGDMHAANLVRELKKLQPGLHYSGMGGDNLRREGVSVLIDMKPLAVVGLVEVLAKYRLIKAALEQLKQHLDAYRPDLLILIDYQEFNQKLAAYAKSIGVPVLFYIGPQVWAWRPKRVFKMAKIVDRMAVIFPFEVPLYEKASVDVTFTGHPLVDEVHRDKNIRQARAALQMADATTVGLFPGSRTGEIRKLMHVFIGAAKRLRTRFPDVQFVLPQAGTIHDEDIAPCRAELDALNVRIIKGRSHDVIQACDAIITASGTATLEIGLMEVPMAIVYRVSPITFHLLKPFVSVRHIGLVNIVAGREVVREFLQRDATAKKIADEIAHILTDNDYNAEMRRQLSGIREKLGGGDGSKNVARLAAEMLAVS